MPEHSSRVSFWIYLSQRSLESQTADLRGWQNMYTLMWHSLKNWSRLVVGVVENPDCTVNEYPLYNVPLTHMVIPSSNI